LFIGTEAMNPGSDRDDGQRFGHRVVGELRQFGVLIRRAERFNRRRRKAEHLHVVVEQIHHPEPLVEIDHRRNPAHALLHVRAARRHGRHALEVLRREDVAEEVDFHERYLSHGDTRHGGTFFDSCA
jgi:hypothetical protein